MFPQMGDDAFVAAAEILLEPVIDAGNAQAAVRTDAGAARMADIVARGRFEIGFESLRGPRGTFQVRASDRGAIDGVMHARITEFRPQNIVLDAVERQ